MRHRWKSPWGPTVNCYSADCDADLWCNYEIKLTFRHLSSSSAFLARSCRSCPFLQASWLNLWTFFLVHKGDISVRFYTFAWERWLLCAVWRPTLLPLWQRGKKQLQKATAVTADGPLSEHLPTKSSVSMTSDAVGLLTFLILVTFLFPARALID